MVDHRGLVVGVGLTIMGASAWSAVAGERTLRWNEAAQSNVLNRSELAKLGEALPAWQIKQMVWPSSEELRSAGVTVDEKLKEDCVVWLAKFLDAKELPPDTKAHLVAMKRWGFVRQASRQSAVCDVFLARFQKGPYSVHIQESPGNVLMTIGCENLPPDGGPDQQALVFQTAGVFLREELRPNPQSKHLHVYRDDKNGVVTTKVMWQIDSVLVEDEKGNTWRDGGKAAELGTWHVVTDTNGRYVRFDIQKFVNEPRRPDPCAKRF
jgi:hypothetical protein